MKFPTIPVRYRKPLAALVGAAGGYAYYHFIGCASGTCPITGNPWISTAYGGLLGWVFAPGRPKSTIASETTEK
jgi:hypothetical protein